MNHRAEYWRTGRKVIFETSYLTARRLVLNALLLPKRESGPERAPILESSSRIQPYRPLLYFDPVVGG